MPAKENPATTFPNQISQQNTTIQVARRLHSQVNMLPIYTVLPLSSNRYLTLSPQSHQSMLSSLQCSPTHSHRSSPRAHFALRILQINPASPRRNLHLSRLQLPPILLTLPNPLIQPLTPPLHRSHLLQNLRWIPIRLHQHLRIHLHALRILPRRQRTPFRRIRSRRIFCCWKSTCLGMNGLG